jgi:glycerol-3-phosphate acyltransferase PlsY
MWNDEFMCWMIIIVLGYLLGSCLFCEWLPWLIHRKDIALESDDGCPGSANVFKLCGWQLGMICLVLDIAKGFLPVYIGMKQLDVDTYLFSLLMLAPVMGHAWPIFHHFWGGKCIATSFGELIALLWVSPVCWILACLYIIFSTVIKISPDNKRSIFVFSLFAVFSFGVELYAERYFIGIGCLLISGIAIFKHLHPVQRKAEEVKA